MLQGRTRAPANSQRQPESEGDLGSQPPQTSRLRVTSCTGSSPDPLPEAVLLAPPWLKAALAPQPDGLPHQYQLPPSAAPGQAGAVP